jgi:hypothetical protein
LEILNVNYPSISRKNSADFTPIRGRHELVGEYVGGDSIWLEVVQGMLNEGNGQIKIAAAHTLVTIS